MAKHTSSLITLFALLFVHSHAISLVLQRMEPYCFLLSAQAGNEVKINYALSGLNEDQVEFRVLIAV